MKKFFIILFVIFIIVKILITKDYQILITKNRRILVFNNFLLKYYQLYRTTARDKNCLSSSYKALTIFSEFFYSLFSTAFSLWRSYRHYFGWECISQKYDFHPKNIAEILGIARKLANTEDLSYLRKKKDNIERQIRDSKPASENNEIKSVTTNHISKQYLI